MLSIHPVLDSVERFIPVRTQICERVNGTFTIGQTVFCAVTQPRSGNRLPSSHDSSAYLRFTAVTTRLAFPFTLGVA